MQRKKWDRSQRGLLPSGARLDPEDYHLLNNRLWAIRGGGYVSAKSNGRATLLHRLVTGAEFGAVVDHINGDRADNRRQNLRVVTQVENATNSKLKPAGRANTSQYRGVYWYARTGKWLARVLVTVAGKQKLVWSGYFTAERDAAEAWDKKTREIRDALARTNF